MNFVENEIYLDREGKEYKYLHKAGGVIIFEDLQTGNNIAQHSSGRYRWDDVEHPRDIVGKK